MVRLRNDEIQLKDALVKLQSLNEALGQDKVDLNKIIRQTEMERDNILNEKQDVEMEKSAVKEVRIISYFLPLLLHFSNSKFSFLLICELSLSLGAFLTRIIFFSFNSNNLFSQELLRTERERIELEAERTGLDQSLQESESYKEKLKGQAQELARTKNELNEALGSSCREKESLSNEFQQIKQENERHTNNLNRMAKEKEEMTRDIAHLSVQLKASERDNRALSEGNASLKADKDSLESSLFELQQLVAKLESRKEQLETENHELNLNREALTVELNRLKKEREIETMKLNKQIELVQQQFDREKRDHEILLNRLKQEHEDERDGIIQVSSFNIIISYLYIFTHQKVFL